MNGENNVSAQTDYAVASGEFLDEWLEHSGSSPASVADAMGVSPEIINSILTGGLLSHEMADNLSKVTGYAAGWWLSIDDQYRKDLARLNKELPEIV